MVTHMEMFSNIKSSLILNASEGNNDLFITGYNSLLANDDTRAARDFYLLLMVYVNYFCIPVFPFVLEGLCRFGKGAQNKFSERIDIVCTAFAFFVQDKELFFNCLFHKKEQVGFIFFDRKLIR